MLSKILKYALNTILGFLVIIGLLVAFSLLPIPGNYKVFTVQSGSMEPGLHMGSLIFVKSQSNYNIGDIITRHTSDPKITITHRIATRAEKNGGVVYQTKGDANDAADAEEITQGSIIGKEVLAVPFLGYPVSYAKTLPGLVLLIIVPAIIIVYDEIQNIASEISTIRNKKLTAKAVRTRKTAGKRYFDIQSSKIRYNLQVPVNFFKKHVATLTKKI